MRGDCYQGERSMSHPLRTLLATTVALAALFTLLKITYADERRPSFAPSNDTFIYLPLISRSTSPAGAYYCYETEFSLIWRMEVITLDANGSSVYAYSYPLHSIVTGTWVYTPSTEVVGFTNFTWLWTIFQPPDRLWNSRYITPPGFEVAINCNRLP